MNSLPASRVTTRREHLRQLGAAAAGAFASGLPTLTAAPVVPPPATADCLVLLWMAGGMAHTETFDPKHYEPFSPGMESKRVLSTFPAIRTSVDHIQISQGLEHIADVMHEGAISGYLERDQFSEHNVLLLAVGKHLN